MAAASSTAQALNAHIPLCVDLDGTFLQTDLLWEYAVALLRQKPERVLGLPFRLLRSRAACKRFLAEQAELDVAILPYNQEVWTWLLGEKSRGRVIVLATAADQTIANAIARHVGLFDQVLGSNGETNNKSEKKLLDLQKKVGRVYDYVGNSRADLPLWRSSRQAIVVNPGFGLEAAARRVSNVIRVFPRSRRRAAAMLRELRPHQWSKNILVLLPVIASHRVTSRSVLWHAALAFLAFCCCASAAYVLNDLLDLETDRHHPKKRSRPFASGDLPLSAGILLVPALLVPAISVTGSFNWKAAAATICYLGLTVAYSAILKRILLVDVFALAALYVLRIVAGGFVTSIRISEWLLSFSFLAFLSLGFCKRAAELERQAQTANPSMAIAKGRRPYLQQDLQQLSINGTICGLVSALILALYIHGDDVHMLYRRPMLLWALFPMALFWFSRLWFLTRHNQMLEDPVLFALKDHITWSFIAVALLVIFVAS